MTIPRSCRWRRFASRVTTPPPVAMMIPERCVSSSITSSSRRRKPSSPSTSKIQGISAPVRSSITLSESKKGRWRTWERCRPRVLLPAPMGPIRKTPGASLFMTPRSVACVDVFDHLRGDKDQQLLARVVIDLATEQVTDPRQVTQQRRLDHAVVRLLLENATQHNRFAITDQNRRLQSIGIKQRLARRGTGADRVVVDLDLHQHFAFRRDLRSDLKTQLGLDKGNLGGTGSSRRLVTDLLARSDQGRLLVSGQHFRGCHQLGATLGIQCGQLKLKQAGVDIHDTKGETCCIGTLDTHVHDEIVGRYNLDIISIVDALDGNIS